tara:strand:- start:14581 stop:15483 length:903 start_codon:yes stop_codon:yes gene_type:complete
MVPEVIKLLNITPDGIYLDGTIGLGGHAQAIVSHLSPKGLLLGLDGDAEALNYSKKNLTASCKIHLFNDSYSNFTHYLDPLNIREFDGMILDLGLSSFQLDTPERGFSYRFNGPLDMRFKKDSGINGVHIVNQWNERELSKLFKTYGEEHNSKAIAKSIVGCRVKQPIKTTFQLCDAVKQVVSPVQINKTLSRIFQAIRIEVNKELNSLTQFLIKFIDYLKIGGRVVILSYHSLEDRLVKNALTDLQKECICPPDFPECICDIVKRLNIITRKPLTPVDTEITVNKRASSAKLRAGEKLA